MSKWPRKRACVVPAFVMQWLFVSSAPGADANDIAEADSAHSDIAHRMHSHEPVVTDAGLSWDELIETTLRRYPAFDELDARRREASAFASAGRRPLAASPSVSMGYLTDAPLDDLDQREFDVLLSLPLWRPGQRAAAQALGATVGIEAGLAAGVMRWQVTGLIRQGLWDIAAARNELELAETSENAVQDILAVVVRRRELGDLPLADELLAHAELFARSMDVIDKQAQLLDVERAYRSLTGLDTRPAEFDEVLTELQDFDDNHPLLAFADAGLARAEAARELADDQTRGSPTLNIGPHRQRDPLGTFYSNSMQLTLNMPVGGRRYGSVARAQANRVVATASAQRSLLRRELDLQLHEAEHELFVVEESLDVAIERELLVQRQL